LYGSFLSPRFSTRCLSSIRHHVFCHPILLVTHLAKRERHGLKGGPLLVLKQPSGGSQSFDEERTCKIWRRAQQRRVVSYANSTKTGKSSLASRIVTIHVSAFEQRQMSVQPVNSGHMRQGRYLGTLEVQQRHFPTRWPAATAAHPLKITLVDAPVPKRFAQATFFHKRRSDRCRCAHHCGSRCCPRFFWRTRILCCSSMLRLRPERPGGRLRAGLGGDGRACSSASRSEAEGREKGAVSARRVEILLKGRLLVFPEEVVTHLLSTGERQRRI
jgi:hypothetical protein